MCAAVCQGFRHAKSCRGIINCQGVFLLGGFRKSTPSWSSGSPSATFARELKSISSGRAGAVRQVRDDGGRVARLIRGRSDRNARQFVISPGHETQLVVGHVFLSDSDERLQIQRSKRLERVHFRVGWRLELAVTAAEQFELGLGTRFELCRPRQSGIPRTSRPRLSCRGP